MQKTVYRVRTCDHLKERVALDMFLGALGSAEANDPVAPRRKSRMKSANSVIQSRKKHHNAADKTIIVALKNIVMALPGKSKSFSDKTSS